MRVKGRNEPVKIYEVFDGAPDEEIEAKLSIKPAFEAALEQYRQGGFQTAREGFETVLADRPEDQASKVFLDRLAHVEQNGFDGEWDGIQVFRH